MVLKKRKYAIGAELTAQGVSFRVFASNCKVVEVVLESPSSIPQSFALTSEKNGYYSGVFPPFNENDLYRFRLNGQKDLYPDPASRFQPTGPFGPSQIIDPSKFLWSDKKWKGIAIENQIIYEMHIGTFTKEGTFAAAQKELEELANLGITLIEIMPLNEFPGTFGWGYDGVNLFAPTHLYGVPDDVRKFIDEAHALNIGVILDVVYNHFGPEGNFIKKFSDEYFKKEKTEWGDAINFEGEDVRQFFLTNARYWIQEYHFDGLRIDATQAIITNSSPHILQEISETVHFAEKHRNTIVIAEDEAQQSIIITPREKGGYGLDAVWNDDFHHSAIMCLTGKREAYYTDYLGYSSELLSCLKYGFLYQGQNYTWQKKNRGTPCLGLSPNSFVIFIQNHDQIGNSGQGHRIHQLTDSGSLRAMTCLLLMSPGTPMLFQGQEFASSSPFLYFAEHSSDLNKLVHRGRKKFLSQFPHLSTKEVNSLIPDPSDLKSFLKSKLDFMERETHQEIYLLHKDLIKLKKTDPIFSQKHPKYDGATLNENVFLLRYFADNNEDRLLMFNFGRDYDLLPASNALLAPCIGCKWKMIWNSEMIKYGGEGCPPFKSKIVKIPAHSALIYVSRV